MLNSYFDIREGREVYTGELQQKGAPLFSPDHMRLAGYVPVYWNSNVDEFHVITDYTMEQVGDYYTKNPTMREKNPAELQFLLEQKRSSIREQFTAAFLHLESRAARAVSSLTLRMADGETAFPDDDFDAGLLWSIEQIKQANRDLLAGLEALTIPDDATFEEAQAIIAQAVAVVPWMPETYGVV